MDMHLNLAEKGTYVIPDAPYFIEKENKICFYKYLYDCTFPNGFCSNMSRRVTVQDLYKVIAENIAC
jgi:hypothetical protein